MGSGAWPPSHSGHGADSICAAIRASWSAQTSADAERWSAERTAVGQCDATSYVLWEHFGGDLVLCEVLVDGARQEHHYFNRFPGGDVDLTAEQFFGHEQILEVAVFTSAEIEARSSSIRPELTARIDAVRAAVDSQLDGTN